MRGEAEDAPRGRVGRVDEAERHPEQEREGRGADEGNKRSECPRDADGREQHRGCRERAAGSEPRRPRRIDKR